MAIEVLTADEVVQWIDYYEQGNELEDDTMTQMMYMAQREAEQTSLVEHITKWLIEASDCEDAAQKEFDDSDCSEARHEIDEWQRVQAFLHEKLNQIPKPKRN